MSVTFHSGRRSLVAQWPRVEELLDEALADGRLVDGPLVARFERALERYTGARHAIAVASGSDALTIALEACGVQAGDEVIVPAYAPFATAASVAQLGARPVFCDVEPWTYALAPRAAEVAMGPRTRAVVPAHLFMQMADMDELTAAAWRAGVEVVEDSAQAIGMTWGGVHAGR